MIKIKLNSKLKEGREAPSLDYGVFIQSDKDNFGLYLIDLDAMREQIEKYKQSHPSDKKIDSDDFFESVKTEETPEYKNPSVIGFIEARQHKDTNEPCLKALDITYTAIHESRSGQGIGKMMYLLAMANAAKKGRPLMPDRLHVEPDAIHIWNSFNRDPSIIKSFDKNGRPVSGKDGEHSEEVASYFDIEDPKKTKMKIDDCSSSNEEPYGVPLNRAYYSEKMYPQLQNYINNFKRFSELNFINPGLVWDGLYDVSHSIFRRRFKN